MSDSQQQTEEQQKAQNLARSRHNQRRSRQKKKEYVAELEATNRELRARGTRATIDMQAIARKVAEENKSLREENTRYQAENIVLRRILSQMGVNEAEIERQVGLQPALSASSMPHDAPTSPTTALHLSTAGERLQGLLLNNISPQSTGEASDALSPTRPQGPITVPVPRQVPQGTAAVLQRLDTSTREGALSARQAKYPSIVTSTRSSFSESGGTNHEYSAGSQAESNSNSVFSMVQRPQEIYGMPPVSQYGIVPTWQGTASYQAVPHTQPRPIAITHRVTTMAPLHAQTATIHNVVTPPHSLHNPTTPLHGAAAIYGQVPQTDNGSTLETELSETRTEQQDAMGYQSSHRFPPGGSQGYG